MSDLLGAFGLQPLNENQEAVNEKDDVISVDDSSVDSNSVFTKLEKTIDDNPNPDPKEDTDDSKPEEKPEEKKEVVVDNKQPVVTTEDTITPERVIYQALIDKGLAESVEKFEPKVLEETLDSLPENIFMQVVSSFPEHIQDLVRLGFNNKNVSREDLLKFLQETDVEEVDLENNMNDYLKSKLVQSGIVKEDDVEDYIDMLNEKGKAKSLAEELYNKDKEAASAAKQAKLEAAEKARKDREKSEREWAQKIDNELNNLQWQKERKEAVRNNLTTAELNRKNAIIAKNPKAVIQLADIYSYLNEETGEFDFSKLIDAKAISKAAENTKDNITKDDYASLIAKMGSGGKKIEKQNTKSDSFKIVNNY